MKILDQPRPSLVPSPAKSQWIMQKQSSTPSKPKQNCSIPLPKRFLRPTDTRNTTSANTAPGQLLLLNRVVGQAMDRVTGDHAEPCEEGVNGEVRHANLTLGMNIGWAQMASKPRNLTLFLSWVIPHNGPIIQAQRGFVLFIGGVRKTRK